MKKILALLKKVTFAGFLIYGYNLIAVNFDLMLPINFITLSFISFLGSPALVAFVLFKILIL